MPSIGCNVNNCTHNSGGACYANKISVNGKKARTSNNTCCSSFLNESNYGSFTNSSMAEGSCNSLNCNVKTCAHNAGNICTLHDVAITSNVEATNLNSETYCSSFRSK
ncbi:MAG: DUF1540 domain-containing protein [Terrisporobacter sp.]|uniref:DUF1540 domain-containing protein n=1 Tax=Terrisporobacter sp. TaxID=1965305 RepID=UPI002FCBC922